MKIEVEHQWVNGTDERWRWLCSCGSRGRWTFQSSGAARGMGEQHGKMKHPTVAQLDGKPPSKRNDAGSSPAGGTIQ